MLGGQLYCSNDNCIVFTSFLFHLGDSKENSIGIGIGIGIAICASVFLAFCGILQFWLKKTGRMLFIYYYYEKNKTLKKRVNIFSDMHCKGLTKLIINVILIQYICHIEPAFSQSC